MAILQLNPAGDLALERGTFVFLEGIQWYRQALACRLRMFLGEWFLNTLEGFPYHRDVLVKGPDLAVIRSDYRQAIITTPGFTEVKRLDLTIDRQSRTLFPDFEAICVAGPIIVAPKDRDFIVRF